MGNQLSTLLQNPVVAKELRGRMRGRRSYLILVSYLLVISGLILGAYLLFTSSTTSLNNVQERQTFGKLIFGMTFWLQLLTVAFIAPALTAGAIAGERERLTFDLLRITLLPASDLLHGKLVAALAFLLLLLVAGLPLQGLAFLFGGVSAGELLASALLLILSAVLYSTLGLFASTLFRRSLHATVMSYGLSLVLFFGVPFFLIGMLFLFGSMNYSPSNAAETTLFWAGYVLVCLNPLSASLGSELLLIDSGSLWSGTVSITSRAITILSPWLPYAGFSILLSLLLLSLAGERLRRPER